MTKETKNSTKFFQFIVFDVISIVLIMGLANWSLSGIQEKERDTIYTHKVSTTLGRVKDIEYISDGNMYSCELPVGTKIETTKALFSQNERPDNPAFEVSITYYNDPSTTNEYTEYSGFTKATNSKRNTSKNQCQKDFMMIGGEELLKLMSSYSTNTVLIAPASIEYYR